MTVISLSTSVESCLAGRSHISAWQEEFFFVWRSR